ncbi:unnamed protein product [Lactuca virosa]|uniref:Uncharacterized protein n=1 Tax=Lactuca virosa TaxID=75947 RepID=A0AAU9LKQ5_9ASTR|nr:unnamed protein product [Lactuca virosa]
MGSLFHVSPRKDTPVKSSIEETCIPNVNANVSNTDVNIDSGMHIVVATTTETTTVETSIVTITIKTTIIPPPQPTSPPPTSVTPPSSTIAFSPYFSGVIFRMENFHVGGSCLSEGDVFDIIAMDISRFVREDLPGLISIVKEELNAVVDEQLRILRAEHEDGGPWGREVTF